MLKQRIITALALLPVALAGLFWADGAIFALFVGLVVCLAAWEWAQLAGYQDSFIRIGYALGVGLCLWVLAIVPQLTSWVLLLALLWWGLASVMVVTYPGNFSRWSGRWRLLMGLLILLPAWQGLVLLKAWQMGNWMIFAVLVLVWAADIGAYFTGKAFGKRKLAPKVSPGKSWEGFYGGLVFSLLLTFLVAILWDWTVRQLLLALPCAALVVGFSVVGDLTESMFKRQAGLKDSSNLLPGHGGVLDRIDSLTSAIPVFAALLWMTGWGTP